MSLEDVVNLAANLADQCPGATMPDSFSKITDTVVRVDGRFAVLSYMDEPATGKAVVLPVAGEPASFVAEVQRQPERPELTAGYTIAKSRFQQSPGALAHGNPTLYTLGEHFKANPDPTIQKLGHITQKFADMPAFQIPDLPVDTDIFGNYAEPGSDAAVELDSLIRENTQYPNRTKVDFNRFYALGNSGAGRYILSVERSEVVDEGIEYPELVVRADTPSSTLIFSRLGGEGDVQAFEVLRDQPVYPQLLDPSITLDEETLLAANDYPYASGALLFEYDQGDAIVAVSKYLQAVDSVAVNPYELFR